MLIFVQMFPFILLVGKSSLDLLLQVPLKWEYWWTELMISCFPMTLVQKKAMNLHLPSEDKRGAWVLHVLQVTSVHLGDGR